MDDPWLRQMRQAPEQTLKASLPRLRRLIGDFKVAGEIKIRPADLYVSIGYRQSGVVLVGDAFATSCPVTGTGTDKVFTDVSQLCNVHIPNWLSTDGMGEDKVSAFYDDAVKVECDAWSAAKAFSFRSVSLEDGLYWRAQRWARFMAGLGEGTVRRLRNRFDAGSGASHRQAGAAFGRPI
jgi:2-polyprenyl-6-methoxyphenol hydroxylase-like FAD-dependent oxidoreductase